MQVNDRLLIINLISVGIHINWCPCLQQRDARLISAQNMLNLVILRYSLIQVDGLGSAVEVVIEVAIGC